MLRQHQQGRCSYVCVVGCTRRTASVLSERCDSLSATAAGAGDPGAANPSCIPSAQANEDIVGLLLHLPAAGGPPRHARHPLPAQVPAQPAASGQRCVDANCAPSLCTLWHCHWNAAECQSIRCVQTPEAQELEECVTKSNPFGACRCGAGGAVCCQGGQAQHPCYPHARPRHEEGWQPLPALTHMQFLLVSMMCWCLVLQGAGCILAELS